GTAAAIEQGLRTVAAAVRARGLNVYAVTLLPRATSTKKDHDIPEYWGPAEQSVMSAVNAWLLSARTGFTGVVNLAAVTADVYNGDCNPNTPFAPYFNPDHLHPNVAGETAMANAISTQLFGLPDAPLDPPVLSATPTPGCAAAKLASSVLAAAAPTTTTTVSPTTTATVAPTTTIPSSLLRSARSLGMWLLLALVVLAGVLALVARRRVLKRRRARRQAMRVVAYPRVPPPAPPRSGPNPRSGPRRR
ncbi:MAG: hypothetical protein KGJ92_01450, partial [Actinomycetales bacterium]|nr:hypothetical protein [Actinomycetales bacterium]